MLNRIVLGLNVIALFIIVGERSNLNGGSFAWLSNLPWSSFATEAWAISAEPTVSSAAILAAWLIITGLWALATVATWVLDRKKAEHQPSSKSTSLGAGLTTSTDESMSASRLDPGLAQGGASNEAGVQNASLPPQVKGNKPTHDIPDPALGSLFDDLSRQVDAFTPEAHAELAKVKKALAALAQKDSGTPNT